MVEFGHIFAAVAQNTNDGSATSRALVHQRSRPIICVMSDTCVGPTSTPLLDENSYNICMSSSFCFTPLLILSIG